MTTAPARAAHAAGNAGKRIARSCVLTLLIAAVVLSALAPVFHVPPANAQETSEVVWDTKLKVWAPRPPANTWPRVVGWTSNFAGGDWLGTVSSSTFTFEDNDYEVVQLLVDRDTSTLSLVFEAAKDGEKEDRDLLRLRLIKGTAEHTYDLADATTTSVEHWRLGAFTRLAWSGVSDTALGWAHGDSITVKMESTDAGADGVASTPNSPATGRPAITGPAQVGETLTAGTSGIADADGLDTATFRYQWIRNEDVLIVDIADATSSTYTPTEYDMGRLSRPYLMVRVNDAENEETLTSAATVAVAAKPNTAATGLPAISGTPQVEESLTASTSAIADEDGLTNVSYSYQWLAGGLDIAGATGSSYELTSSEQGQIIQVRVSFTDDRDNAETLTSAATVTVVAAPNREATGQPTISGTPQVGETLTAGTANIADLDGLTGVSYSYQWIAGGTDIAGATGSTYTLTASEQGKTIQMRVTFSDDADNQETLTSEATEAVAAPVPLTVSVTVSAPATHDGSSEFTFEIEFSEEFGLSYKTLKLHAFNVTGGSVEKAQRTNKPSNISWRITVKPTSTGDVMIELPATADCGATGAICTGDGRKLSNSLSFVVSDPN